MENVINQSMKKSVNYLHQTKDPDDPLKHRAIVCIICDRFIIGTEAIHKLTKEQILFQEGIAMVMQLAQFVTVECKHQWHPKNSSQICNSKWICH